MSRQYVARKFVPWCHRRCWIDGEPSSTLGFNLLKETYRDLHMTKVLTEDRLNRPGGGPLKVAIAVAVLGVLGMLVVDHGPWNKPKVQPAFMASYSSTGEAARAAGAKVMPTESKLQVEPEPPVPKPVHPVNPAPR
jgi:hypothetical protein